MQTPTRQSSQRYRQMCDKKRRHSWKDQAEQHREQLLRDAPHVIAPERLEVYACLHCWGWHVGHTPMTKEERAVHRDQLARRPMNFEQAMEFFTAFGADAMLCHTWR